ncbi:hypothetical protein [uncultured Phycicoccus sp.]|uniref:hypothetical protein n=1 Tax=uncultured Phycicoccus sp. TaxID=661422 RepID=UPI00260871E7|nr:hypothetical protein [uncultured Phycicoccus sp.]
MSHSGAWREVEDFLAGLDGVRLRDDPRGRRWCVRNRLVARQVDESTLLVRADLESRERLLDRYPDTFSMRPNLEAHMKVLADVENGDLAAVREALRAAWEMQRGM